MFFVASKIIWLMLQPISLVLLLLAAGWLLAWRYRRTGLVLQGLGVLLLALCCFTNLGAMLIQPLENRFARPETAPASVAAIIVLGGSTDGRIGLARGVTELSEAGDRMTEAAVLARLYPDAPVLISGGLGGIGAVVGPGGSETDAASGARFLLQHGIAADRLVLDDTSRNTDENAENSRALLNGDGAPILLVTSAFHMPRSVGLYRKQGFDVVAWPVDFRSTGTEGFGLAPAEAVGNLATVSTAAREWLGLLAYAATGRIDTLFPEP